jgi:P4 family phage/plasmid primase-like protien
MTMPIEPTDIVDDIERQMREQQENQIRFAAEYTARVDGRIVFLVKTLADDIMDMGPLAQGVDDRFWSYQGGVWSPDPHVVRNRSTELLQERFQVGHVTNAEAFVSAQVPVITCDPVKELINFQNGLLDWKSGELRPHSSEVMSTTQLSTDYDPGAECPEFEKFLNGVVPADVVDLVWELIGYMMYSGNPLHKAVMLHGQGRNGKGTLIRVIKRLLGERNITAQSLQALASERFAPASLFGKLANIAGDIDGTYMEQTAKFKGITGEDVITAEFKGRDAFEFTPYAVPMFSANKIPGSADVTTGYMSRWVVIPFPNDFTGREDRHLDERLQVDEEIRGIAAKGVEALRRLMARGNFEEPESAREAMDDFRRRVDQVRTWVDEKAELGPDFGHVSRSALYSEYKKWASDNGVGQLRATEFYDRLQNAGAAPATINGSRGFKGIRLLVPDDDPWRK